jgi:hypothetical protein
MTRIIPLSPAITGLLMAPIGAANAGPIEQPPRVATPQQLPNPAGQWNGNKISNSTIVKNQPKTGGGQSTGGGAGPNNGGAVAAGNETSDSGYCPTCPNNPNPPPKIGTMHSVGN